MSSQGPNNTKLGIFVLAGLSVLVISMYLIGKNQNLFGSNFTVKARFREISGLIPGNSVRFSGINAGTVKTIHILNDTCIEISMVLDKKLQSFIKKNSIADIGNEGLMGNKVVNITPENAPASSIEDGDLLQSKAEVNTGNMLETFSHTNDNVEVISSDLKYALKRFNSSSLVWDLLEDTSLAKDVKVILGNFKKSSASFNASTTDLHDLLQGIKKGDGIAGLLLSDKKEANNLKGTLDNLNKVSDNVNKLTAHLEVIANQLQAEMATGHGTLPTLLRDSTTANKLNKTLSNLEQGSNDFKVEMQSLKQNKYLKKYISKDEQQKKVGK